jgi:3-methyladenine DNA glycosylase AlkD
MTRQAENPHQELEKKLRACVRHDPVYKAFREKTTRLTVLGLRLPVMQEVEQNGCSFYDQTPDKILKAWNHLWRTATIHEVMSLPLFYYRRHAHQLDPAHWHTMKTWIERVENWEHADALCQIYSILFERYPKLVKLTLRKWNRSKNPWKRRASVVSTIYYASKKRTPPPLKTVLSLVTPLLRDKDAYVQKGVGWQLREAYKIWPRETLAFLESHILELPAITFSYATEKLAKKDKERLKKKRKSSR